MSEKFKDVAVRALKTFWQTALAYLIVSMPQVVDLIGAGWGAIKPVLVSAGIGALAAGLSAVYNGVLKPLAEKLKSNNTSAEE